MLKNVLDHFPYCGFPQNKANLFATTLWCRTLECYRTEGFFFKSASDAKDFQTFLFADASVLQSLCSTISSVFVCVNCQKSLYPPTYLLLSIYYSSLKPPSKLTELKASCSDWFVSFCKRSFNRSGRWEFIQVLILVRSFSEYSSTESIIQWLWSDLEPLQFRRCADKVSISRKIFCNF